MNIKYLPNGQKVEVVEQLKDGTWLVYRIFCYGYEDYDEEISEETPTIVRNVFDEPPKEKVAEELRNYLDGLRELRKDIETLEREKHNLEGELRSARSKHEERMKKYKRYEALKNLDDFLNDKITHYVVCWLYEQTGEIVSIDEYTDSYSHQGRRLLSLFGDSKGNLSWKINGYKDGSGSWYNVYPFCSLEEARGFLQLRFDNLDFDKVSMRYVEQADKEGFKLPKGYKKLALSKVIDIEKEEIRKDKERLKGKEEKLKNLIGEL